jgi:Tol biopolymer transport system component
VWSPDATQLAFRSSRNPSGVYLKSLNTDRKEELILSPLTPRGHAPVDWSRDGRYLLLVSETGLAVLPEPGRPDGKPIELPGTRGADGAQFSPDGRWIAYMLENGGDVDVFVRPFDAAEPARSSPAAGTQVSSGGRFPRWSADGRELFYGSTTSPALKVGRAVELFPLPAGAAGWAIAPDGPRFFFNTGDTTTPPFTVMLNWQSMLRR